MVARNGLRVMLLYPVGEAGLSRSPMIDPRARRASKQAEQQADGLASVAQVMAILLELAPLQGLQWPILAQKIETLTNALRGIDGISQDQILQLRRWAACWQSLPMQVRDFYRSELPADPVCAALWIVIEQQKHLSGPLRGELERRWISRYGVPPSVSLSLPISRRSP